MISQLQIFAIGIAWVGGWRFVFFVYPELACRLFRQEPTEGHIKAVRWIGAVELIIVFVSCISTFVIGFFPTA